MATKCSVKCLFVRPSVCLSGHCLTPGSAIRGTWIGLKSTTWGDAPLRFSRSTTYYSTQIPPVRVLSRAAAAPSSQLGQYVRVICWPAFTSIGAAAVLNNLCRRCSAVMLMISRDCFCWLVVRESEPQWTVQFNILLSINAKVINYLICKCLFRAVSTSRDLHWTEQHFRTTSHQQSTGGVTTRRDERRKLAVLLLMLLPCYPLVLLRLPVTFNPNCSMHNKCKISCCIPSTTPWHLFRIHSFIPSFLLAWAFASISNFFWCGWSREEIQMSLNFLLILSHFSLSVNLIGNLFFNIFHSVLDQQTCHWHKIMANNIPPNDIAEDYQHVHR